MNHPFLETYPSIDAIFEGRFTHACQSETIILLGRAMIEPASEPRIVWGVRGAESTTVKPPKVDKKSTFLPTFLHSFCSEYIPGE